MSMDFSHGAGVTTQADLIPNGQLAFAILTIKGIKNNANTGSRSIEFEATIDEGQPFARRKIFGFIGDPNHEANSEGYRQMGLVAITRILESGRGAGPNNPAGYQINGYEQLGGLRVPIKIGIEPGQNGYADKNKVAEWLTPNPASQSGHKLYQKLMAGDFGGTPAKPAQVSNGFGGAAATPQGAQGGGGFGNAQAGAATPSSGFGTAGAASPAAAAQQPGGWLQQAQGAAVDDGIDAMFPKQG